ncbi:MAG: hypothetical protein CMA85_00895 [Euryarchaeota archaeon]|nr:hypothetical protein [Euryarchaeota archaeon]
MSDAEKVKGLLDGTVEPSELEDDSELYALAERIYGREVLDEMGITAPVVLNTVFEEPENYNGNNLEIELPDVPIEAPSKPVKKPRTRKMVLITGLLGLMVLGMNLVVGIGALVELCEDPPKDLPLEFNSKGSLQDDTLHVTWTITNMKPALNYSLHWVITENGSHTLVDTNWFNWSSQSTLIHVESRTIVISPWCYISTLYENNTEIASSNDCEGQVSIMTSTNAIVDGGCDDNPRLVWSRVNEYNDLNSWAPAGSGGVLDGALLMLFTMIAVSGLRRK